MLRSFVLAAAFLLMGIASAQAERFNHNGSVVEIMWGNGLGFAVYYVYPRSGLPDYVDNDTLLLDGTWDGATGLISATARIFSSRCGTAEYEVHGYEIAGGFYLEGAAPVRDSRCRIVRYEFNDNAYLYFYSRD